MIRVKYFEEIFKSCTTQNAPGQRVPVFEQIRQSVDRIGISGEREEGDQVAGIGC